MTRFGLSQNTLPRCLALGVQLVQLWYFHLGITVGAAGRRSTTPGTTLAGDSLATRGGIGIGISATAAIGAAGASTFGGVGADCIVPGTIITIITAGTVITTITADSGMVICGAVAEAIGIVAETTTAHATTTLA